MGDGGGSKNERFNYDAPKSLVVGIAIGVTVKALQWYVEACCSVLQCVASVAARGLRHC